MACVIGYVICHIGFVIDYVEEYIVKVRRSHCCFSVRIWAYKVLFSMPVGCDRKTLYNRLSNRLL